MWFLHAHHNHVLHSMWNVHSQNSSWNQSLLCLALKLHVWSSFHYRSGCRSGRPRNRKSTYQRQRETVSCCVWFSCCVWLAPYDYRLARNDSHLRFCCERGPSTKGINQDHLRAEGFCYLSMARSTKKTYLSGRFPSIAPRTNLISTSWVEGFGYRSIRRVNEKYIYTYRRCLWPVTAQGQSKSEKQALEQPQMVSGRLLKMKTKKVMGTVTSQKPAHMQPPGYLTELKYVKDSLIFHWIH